MKEVVNEQDLLTVPEAAMRCGLSQVALRSALHRGTLPYTHRYGRKLIKPADLDTYRATAKVGRPYKRKTDEDAKPVTSVGAVAQ